MNKKTKKTFLHLCIDTYWDMLHTVCRIRSLLLDTVQLQITHYLLREVTLLLVLLHMLYSVLVIPLLITDDRQCLPANGHVFLVCLLSYFRHIRCSSSMYCMETNVLIRKWWKHLLCNALWPLPIIGVNEALNACCTNAVSLSASLYFRCLVQAVGLMPRSRMLGSRNFLVRFSEFRAFQWTRKSELGNLLKFK